MSGRKRKIPVDLSSSKNDTEKHEDASQKGKKPGMSQEGEPIAEPELPVVTLEQVQYVQSSNPYYSTESENSETLDAHQQDRKVYKWKGKSTVGESSTDPDDEGKKVKDDEENQEGKERSPKKALPKTGKAENIKKKPNKRSQEPKEIQDKNITDMPGVSGTQGHHADKTSEKEEQDLNEGSSSRNDTDSRPDISAGTDTELAQKLGLKTKLSEMLWIFNENELKTAFSDIIEREEKLVERTQRSIFIKRLIRYWSRERAALMQGSNGVKVFVTEYVNNLSFNIAKLEPKFSTKDQPHLVGSVAEGAKIIAPDEFDFLYVLDVQNENLNIRHIRPDTFKPRTNNDIFPVMYFKLKFKQIPDKWKSKKNDTSDPVDYQDVLNARKMQEQFQNTMKKMFKILDEKEPTMSLNGPSVTLKIRLSPEARKNLEVLNASAEHIQGAVAGNPNDKRHKTLKNMQRMVAKIDLTLAIPISKSSLLPHLKESDREKLPTENEAFYLVPSGDFWRLSCSHLETDKMVSLLNNHSKGDCFQALKFLRDELDITDPLASSSSLLGTYPLKIAFMKRADKDNTNEWAFKHLGKRLGEILEDVETKGQNGSLTGYFLKKEPVLMESDKCYVECRRIKQHLTDMNQTYLQHGLLHTIVLIFFLLCSVALTVRCAIAFVDIMELHPLVKHNIDDCEITTERIGEMLSVYLFWHIPLSVLMLLLTVCCAVGIILHRCCWYSQQPLYRMYVGVLSVHVILAFLSLSSCGIGIGMTIMYRMSEGCHPSFPSTLFYLLLTTIVIGGVPVLLFIMFITVTCVIMKCQCSKHRYEWVFFDRLWRDCCYKQCGKFKCCSRYCCSHADQ